MTKIPLVLAGPVVRRVDNGSATVWVALRDAGLVGLDVYEDMDGAPGPIVASGEASTVRLGERLHVVAVTARAPLGPGRGYLYDLRLPGGLGLRDEGAIAFGVADATPVDRLVYPGRSLPGLRTFASEPADVRFAHGSCRKAHGKGADALALLDAEMAAALADGGPPPIQGLFLTGDQIYADDVHPNLLEGIQDAARILLGGDQEANHDLLPHKRDLKPRRREALVKGHAGFTSGAASSHLVTFAEFALMYLFAWSDVPWRVVKVLPEGELRAFRQALPAVRRVLANVPVWMLFDDHDVTDDWNRTGEWVTRVAAAPLGNRIVYNALTAYALFQHWGNDPSAFAAGTAGGALLGAVNGWDGRDGAQADAVRATLHLPTPTPDQAPPPAQAIRWSWTLDTPSFRVIAPDCRTRRGYPAPDSAPALLSESARAELLAIDRPGRFTVLLAPTPIIGVKLLTWVQRTAGWIEHHRPEIWNTEDLADIADCEGWHDDRGSREIMLKELASWGEVLVLSGDVHYGFAATLASDHGHVVNLVSSSLRNQSFPTIFTALLWLGKEPLAGTDEAGTPSPPLDLEDAPITLDGEVYLERVLARTDAETSPLAGNGPNVQRAQVVREPNVGVVRFPPGKVEQRLLYAQQAPGLDAVKEIVHVATFLP